MLPIDKTQFHHNLELTKAYCHAQMAGKEADVARVFRSYNPIVNGGPLYTFKKENFDFEIELGIRSCTKTEWLVYPITEKDFVDSLFVEQLQSKERNRGNEKYETSLLGRIVISQIDCTLTDGASEVESQGLFDVYDMPPVDTWFYLCNSNEGRLLFAWIPTAFVERTQGAIDVNMVNCIGWFDEWFEADYWITMGV